MKLISWIGTVSMYSAKDLEIGASVGSFDFEGQSTKPKDNTGKYDIEI